MVYHLEGHSTVKSSIGQSMYDEISVFMIHSRLNSTTGWRLTQESMQDFPRLNYNSDVYC